MSVGVISRQSLPYSPSMWYEVKEVVVRSLGALFRTSKAPVDGTSSNDKGHQGHGKNKRSMFLFNEGNGRAWHVDVTRTPNFCVVDHGDRQDKNGRRCVLLAY